MTVQGSAGAGRSLPGSTVISGPFGPGREATDAVTALLRARTELTAFTEVCTQLEGRLALITAEVAARADRGFPPLVLVPEPAQEPDEPPTSPGHARRRVGAVAVAALAGAGSLLIADAIATVTWQEPVSALLAHQRQNELEDQLSGLETRLPDVAPAPARRRQTPEQRIRRLAAAERLELRNGKAIGRVRAPRLGGSWVVVEGTGESQLKAGPGRYPTSSLPGLPGTTAIAGHRTTYGAPFRDIDRLRAGDRITVEMPYGTVDYRVEGHRVVDPSNTEVLRDIGRPRLVLTACTPLFSAAQRWVVFARQERVRPRTMS